MFNFLKKCAYIKDIIVMMIVKIGQIKRIFYEKKNADFNLLSAVYCCL
jgi:hypothetical protein